MDLFIRKVRHDIHKPHAPLVLNLSQLLDITMRTDHSNPVKALASCSQSATSNQPIVTSSGIELLIIPSTNTQQNELPSEAFFGAQDFSLPPVDRGKDAWLCLLGSFVLEMVVWGRFCSSVLDLN